MNFLNFYDQTEDRVFERIFLPIVKYTPLHPPLLRGELKGVRQKPRRAIARE